MKSNDYKLIIPKEGKHYYCILPNRRPYIFRNYSEYTGDYFIFRKFDKVNSFGFGSWIHKNLREFASFKEFMKYYKNHKRGIAIKGIIE